MHILLFLLILVIVIVLFGLSIVGVILRTIFGIGRRPTSRPNATSNERTNGQQRHRSNPNNDTYTSYDSKEDHSSEDTLKKHKKIFNKEDGEYVDFEEIKN